MSEGENRQMSAASCAKQANEWAAEVNERADEQMAQYSTHRFHGQFTKCAQCVRKQVEEIIALEILMKGLKGPLLQYCTQIPRARLFDRKWRVRDWCTKPCLLTRGSTYRAWARSCIRRTRSRNWKSDFIFVTWKDPPRHILRLCLCRLVYVTPFWI